MRILTSFLHLICQISVTEQLFLNFKIAASDFVIVGCEQLPLIFAELKVLISDVRQAHTGQTHAELSRGTAKGCECVGWKLVTNSASGPLAPPCPCSCLFSGAVQDPCAVQNGGCMHDCRLDGTRPHCACRVGFILAEDRKTCQGKFTDPR